MNALKTISNYGMLLFGLAVMLNIALFVLAWMRG